MKKHSSLTQRELTASGKLSACSVMKRAMNKSPKLSSIGSLMLNELEENVQIS